MALAETAVLAVDLKLTGATQFKSGIAEADAAALSLGKTVSTSSNILGGSASNFGLVKQAAISTGTALKGMGEHLKSVITGPLGMIGLGAGLFTLAGLFKESVGEAEALGLATEKLTALTGESAAVVSTQIAVFQKYGISIDKAATLMGFAEKTLGKLNESMAQTGSTVSKAKAQDNVRIATERLNVAQQKLIETEHRHNVTQSALTAAHNRVTDALVKLRAAQATLNGAVDSSGPGITKLVAFQKQYGIVLTDAKGRAVDFETELRNVADFYTSNAAASTKAYVASVLFGRGYQALIPVLRLGSEGIKEAEQAAAELGLTLTDENAVQLRDYQKSIRAAGESLAGLKLQIGLAVIPAVKDMADALTRFLAHGGTQKVVSFFKDLVVQARVLGGVITGTVIPTLQGLAGAAKGFWDTIPAPLRDLIFKGVVADRTIHFLFGVSPIHLVSELATGALTRLLGGLGGGVFARGSSPMNPLYVSSAGVPGGGLASASLLSLIIPAVVAAVAAKAITDLTNQQFKDAGYSTNFAAPGSHGDNPLLALLPFGIGGSIQNLIEGIHLLTGETKKAAEAYGPSTSMSPLNAQGGVGGSPYGPYVTALHANTAALHDAARKASDAAARQAQAADRLARGIKDSGPSKSLDPRFRFLAGSHSGAQDAAVSHALAIGFQRAGSNPVWGNAALVRAIKVLQHDQKTVGHAAAAAIGKDIAALKTELARRIAAAADRQAAAVHAQGIIAAAAVKDADQNALVASNDTTKAVDATKTDLRGKITTVAGNVDKARSGIVTAARGTTAATYHGAASVVGAIRANRPITNVTVNVSATTVQQKTTVVERYGPTSGDRNGSNGSGTQGNGGA